jgi:hypothetical protein
MLHAKFYCSVALGQFLGVTSTFVPRVLHELHLLRLVRKVEGPCLWWLLFYDGEWCIDLFIQGLLLMLIRTHQPTHQHGVLFSKVVRPREI